MANSKYPISLQADAMDCGAACLRMIAAYHGREFLGEDLREYTYQGRDGVSFLGISDAAEHIGMDTLSAHVSYDDLATDLPLPAVAHWEGDHFVVVYDADEQKVTIGDPAVGLRTLAVADFLRSWTDKKTAINTADPIGALLMMEPLPAFFEHAETPAQGRKAVITSGWRNFQVYFKQHTGLLWQLGLGVGASTVLQLLIPLLIYTLVDEGILDQDYELVYLLFGGWLLLMLFRLAIEFFRNSILSYVSTRINLKMVSQYLAKIIRLPVSFFDRRLTQDLLMRIDDHKQIERLLTSEGLQTLVSLISVVAMSILLLIFSPWLFAVFVVFGLVYWAWMRNFLRKSMEISLASYESSARNKAKLAEFLDGIREIKLNNAEKYRQWDWETAESHVYYDSLKLERFKLRQSSVGRFLNESKDLVVLFIGAQLAMEGSLSIGALFAILYIIRYISSGIGQIVEFTSELQNAWLSLERIGEIDYIQPEELGQAHSFVKPSTSTISFNKVSFEYPTLKGVTVLDELDLVIAPGKLTTIVGPGGSGKSTLLRLLMRLYEPTAGEIRIGEVAQKQLPLRWWRENCGAIFQDSTVFSDTVLGNITLSKAAPDEARLRDAIQKTGVDTFISRLPEGYNTLIGTDGIGLSAGEYQRLLLARIIYQDPQFVFLDEVTSALDSEQEITLWENLEGFFHGKTVVVVAHRLSTVMSSDHIVVMQNGHVVQKGEPEPLRRVIGPFSAMMQKSGNDKW